MREINGELRGLLKKPNRPPTTRKNRVVFDETRNEFFEADYIILIREDCAFDEEEEESCTCGEHELVRLCCEEGCQCRYSSTGSSENRTTRQSPKFAPSIEFVDEAALSPPDGYKDNSVKNSFAGSLRGHIFGAQHIQQLQVIQRLQQQRAAMLAARTNKSIPPPPPPPAQAPSSTNSETINQHYLQQQSTNVIAQQTDKDSSAVCTECAECAECAAKQIRNSDECIAKPPEEIAPLHIPAVSFYPLHASSPERRITEKEIIAGEERPKYIAQSQIKQSPVKNMTREPAEDVTSVPRDLSTITNISANSTAYTPSTKSPIISVDNNKPVIQTATSKENSPTHISGILKGGKLWKLDSSGSQSDETSNVTSEDEGGASIKRSVRFETEEAVNKENNNDAQTFDSGENQINELIPIKKHSTLFNNVSRPNSAVRQLFPSAVHQKPVLTSEALRAFDESKRAGLLVTHLPGSCEFDGVKQRTIDRNTLRRSLIK